jgi:hypothetical protein
MRSIFNSFATPPDYIRRCCLEPSAVVAALENGRGATAGRRPAAVATAGRRPLAGKEKG